MRKCPNCGHKNDDVNFCSSCGRRLKSGRKIKILWIALAVVAVIGLLIGAKLYSEKDSVAMETKSDATYDDGRCDENALNQLQNSTISTSIAPTEEVVDQQEKSAPAINIDLDCDHIFEVFTGKNGVETNCRFCGISPIDLYNAGIELPDVDCEHNYEKVIQTNGTPAYECKNCHKICLYNFPPLTDLKLLSDTNAKGKNADVKYGTFYHNGFEWKNAVRFWVADKSGYTNTESMEVYLANAYTELYAVVFAADESDDDTNMTLRFYGDGELIYEMTNITKDAEERDTKIDVTDVEVLKVACSTEMDAFGYCVLYGIVS